MIKARKSFIFQIRVSGSATPFKHSPYKIETGFAGLLEQWIESDHVVQVWSDSFSCIFLVSGVGSILMGYNALMFFVQTVLVRF